MADDSKRKGSGRRSAVSISMDGKQSTWKDFTAESSFHQVLFARFLYRRLLHYAYTFCFQGTMPLTLDGLWWPFAFFLGGKYIYIFFSVVVVVVFMWSYIKMSILRTKYGNPIIFLCFWGAQFDFIFRQPQIKFHAIDPEVNI